MSAVPLLQYREPSQRVAVRPWAVIVHRNAEQEEAHRAAVKREQRRARKTRRQALAEPPPRETWAVAFTGTKYPRSGRQDGRPFLGATVYHCTPGADPRKIEKAVKRALGEAHPDCAIHDVVVSLFPCKDAKVTFHRRKLHTLEAWRMLP